MKVLILSAWGFLPPFCGTRRVVHDTALGLEQRGHSVLGILAAQPRDLPTIPKHLFETVCISSVWLRVEAMVSRLCSVNEGLRYFWSGICKPIRSIVLEMFPKKKVLVKAKRFMPDLILAEDMYIAPLGVRISSQLDVPFCYRVHHLHSIQHTRQRFLEKIIERWESDLFARSDALISFTDQDDTLLRQRCHCRILQSQFGLHKHDANNHDAPPTIIDGKYVLYVSSYVGEEEPWLKKLAQHCALVSVVIVGEGGKDLIDCPPNVVLMGTVPNGVLVHLYKRCNFAFFPLSWKPGQGFPTKLAEAFINGVPILMFKNVAHLLPAKAEAVEVYADEKELYEKADYLLAQELATINRVRTPFDISVASRDLEGKLYSIFLDIRRMKDV